MQLRFSQAFAQVSAFWCWLSSLDKGVNEKREGKDVTGRARGVRDRSGSSGAARGGGIESIGKSGIGDDGDG